MSLLSSAKSLSTEPALRIDNEGFIGRFTKRAFDIVFACICLILAAPLFLLIAILIKLESRGPVFFHQMRVGRNRRLFSMWKFRKMRDRMPDQGPSLTRRFDMRLTTVGRLLERTKLDELPQLINILRGEMSAVGPRPELPKFVEHYPHKWDQVLSVKPGLFGPCQLHFRNESELYPDDCTDLEAYYVERILPRKLEIDSAYAAQHSTLNDISILIRALIHSVTGTITRQTILNRRYQIINFLILWMTAVAGTYLSLALTSSSLPGSAGWHLLWLSILIKPLCLLYYRVPKALATSVTADDFERICWCAVTSAAMILCAMIFLDNRDLSRLAFILDTVGFVALLVVYKLACYNLFLCFKVQESRALARRLFLWSFLVGPLSLAGVLTLRHGLHAWTNPAQRNLSLTFVCLAAVIRPTFIIFKPPLSRPSASSWLLREWGKLCFGAVIGTAILVSGCFLLNERSVSRLDMLFDCALYLTSMTVLALSKQDFPIAPSRSESFTENGTFEEPERERLLILGSGLELSAYVSALSALPEHHFEIVGIVMPHHNRSNQIGGVPILGTISDVPEIVKARDVNRLIAVGSSVERDALERLRNRCNFDSDQLMCVELLGPLMRSVQGEADSSIYQDAV
jgi:lipopolysaccharide/colanic/teichoic acid biosynthesis glycosyltransferase